MSMEMRFDGLDEMIKECHRLSSTSEVEKVDKKIIKKCAQLAHTQISSKLPRSKDVNKSGRSGSRTFIHSADAVPVSGVRRHTGRLYILVGWDQGDNSPYFYTKFNEWGTSTRPPTPVFLPIAKEINAQLHQLGIEEYSQLLEFLEG